MSLHENWLLPKQPIPQNYSANVTNEILRMTATGKIAGKPILAGEMVMAPRQFATWSLFLISNPSWLRIDSSDRIRSLHRSYLGFARAIGGQHAAVWFARGYFNSDGTPVDDLAKLIDTDRCAKYAALLGLDLRKSPHVVVTTQYPDLKKKFKQALVIELNGLSPTSTEALLTELASQLVNSQLDQAELTSEKWWLIWTDTAKAVFSKLKALISSVEITWKDGEWKASVNLSKNKSTSDEEK